MLLLLLLLRLQRKNSDRPTKVGSMKECLCLPLLATHLYLRSISEAPSRAAAAAAAAVVVLTASMSYCASS
jgi:hypothetical protein